MKTIVKVKLSILSLLFLIGCSTGTGSVNPSTNTNLESRWKMTSVKYSYQAKINGIIESDGEDIQGTANDVIELKAGKLSDPNDVLLTGESEWNYKLSGSQIIIDDGVEISYFKFTQSGKTLRLEMDITLAKKSLKESKDFNLIIGLDPSDEVIKFNYILEFVVAAAEDTKVIVQEDPKLAPAKSRNVIGTWVANRGGAGGTGNFESFKNFQYNFDVGANNQKVDITLKSQEIDVQFALFDPLGQRINVSSTGRSVTNTYTLNAGKYRLVVCAARRAVGKFDFLINGILGNPVEILSANLQSGTRSWGDLGGAGNVFSFKNHFYKFEVTDDNFSIDFEIESPDTNVEMILYDPLGKAITTSFFSERYRFKIIAAKKGTYTIMAATDKRGGVGNYRLSIFGKVQNLQRVASQVNTTAGRWANNNSFDTYSLLLTANSSPLDIELSSADAKGYIDLLTSTGNRIVFSVVPSNNEFIVRQNMAKGEYRILVAPGKNAGSGNYTLSVHGQFTDFKKL